MNRKLLAIIVVLLIIVISVAGAFAVFLNQTTPSTYSSFSLNASGTAYDTAQQKTTNVYISVTGTARGTMETSVDLQIKGGSVSVLGYSFISVASGQSSLSSKSSNIGLSLVITATGYGLSPTSWSLQGITENATSTIPVTLTAQQLTLPFEGGPALTNLSVSGNFTLQ